MMFGARTVKYPAIIVVVLLIAGFLGPFASAQERSVREMMLSLVRPGVLQQRGDEESGTIDKLLSFPPGRFDEVDEDAPLVLARRPGKEGHKAGVAPFWELTSVGRPLPDRNVVPSERLFSKLASIRPMIVSGNGRADDLVDSGSASRSVGGLVRDPRWLYSRLEIRVNRSAYTLELWGYRDDEAKRLYFTKVGLGSPEYPTPRGSFFIMRIFDHKPLWIPPQDRDWAYGQVPSHSVYGGHMMPFFTKRPNRGGTSAGSEETDLLAPKMQMLDAGMYRIHGTDSPWSVGSGQSHGCVRMVNKTVKELADHLKMYAGMGERGESPNGPYVNLARPVRLILY